MKSTFPGFPDEGMKFLRDLKKNNNREWFTPRKPVFEEKVRRPMIELVSAIHREMLRFAPDYVGEPAKCIYRIYRDIRFSKDKTPYKTYASALLLRNGFDKNEGSAAFYLGVSPENIEVAGGIYTPDRDVLTAVRQHVADHHKDFRATFEKPKIRKLFGDLSGESLTRVPKGFDADHPAADLIRRKQYLLDAKIDPKLAVTPSLLKEIVTRLEAMTPFIEFLDQPLLRRKTKQKRDQKFMS
jgi:uncharacterized protein (TIGR02453 family)